MQEIPIYFLKVSGVLWLVYSIYYLFLRHLTFYTWNRWYLLLLPFSAMLLPFADVSGILLALGVEPKSFGNIPPVETVFTTQEIAGKSGAEIFAWIFYAGAIILFLRLLVQVISLLRMKKSAELMVNGPVKIYRVNAGVLPFSFLNSIYIDPSSHEEDELKKIIRHEFVHIKQRHTIDIFLSELLVILNWYNPFAWLLRSAARQNLEFIADEQVIMGGVDRKQYQYLLLKVTGAGAFNIGTQFNFISLKKRIVMMNKNRSARRQLTRFALVLPLLAGVLLAFRSEPEFIALSPLEISQDTVPKKANKLPANVQHISVKNKQAVVRMVDGTTETYNLNDPAQREEFERKYPPPPVPPAPPAPAPPAPPVPDELEKGAVPDLPASHGKTGKHKKNGQNDKSAPVPPDGIKKPLPPPPPPVPPVPPRPDEEN